MREESRIEVLKSRLGLGFPRRIAWSAIFAGVFVALGVALLLTFLGAGIGASTINPLQEQNPFQGLGIGALIWTLVTGIIAFFFGGWVAGYGSGWAPTRGEAMTHAAVTWALASIAVIWLVTGAAGALLAGGAGLVGHTISGGAQAATQTPGLSASIKEELEKRGIDVNSLEQQARSPETQARAEQTARQAGEKVAKGVSMASLGVFVALLLDLIASVFGGLVAIRNFDRGVTTTTTTERAA
jgi:hypothetical protein